MLCDRTKSSLLVIDIQEKLAAAMPAAVLQQLLRNTKVLLEAARALTVPVLITEQYPQGLGATHADVRNNLPAAQTFHTKTCFSACGAADIKPLLTSHAQRQFILTGMETHVCVLQTALELQQRGAQIFVVEDAVCSRFQHNFKNAIARLRQAGVIITSTESVLFEWLRDASHPQFKTLSRLIR